MRLRKKPRFPKRLENIVYAKYVYKLSLKDVLDWAEENELDTSKIKFEKVVTSYSKDKECVATIVAPESEKSYNDRLDKHENDLIKYEKWYKDNRDKINQELQKRINKIKSDVVASYE